MDMNKVTAAVKIRISVDRLIKKRIKLEADLDRLRASMDFEERNEYYRRLA